MITGCDRLVRLASTAAELTVDAAIKAIGRNICWWDYWIRPKPDRYHLPAPVAATVRVDDEFVHVFSDGWFNEDRGKYTAYHRIEIRNGVPTVAYEVFHGAASKSVDEDRRLTFAPGAVAVTLSEPGDCTPVFDPDTPLKQRYLRQVLRSMSHTLSFGEAPIPKRVRIIVANFNLDYLETHVLVPQTGELFSVPMDEDALENGPNFITQPLRGDRPELREEILRHVSAYEIEIRRIQPRRR